MGVFTELHDRIDTVRVTKGISTLVHDRLDSINEDSKNNYPLILYRITNETSSVYNRNQDNVILSIDFFISDLWYQGSTDTLANKMDAMVEQLDSVIKEIPLKGVGGNTFNLVASSSAEYAWEQHNDDLFVCKRTVQIGASRLNC